jgi:hypothetical protein
MALWSPRPGITRRHGRIAPGNIATAGRKASPVRRQRDQVGQRDQVRGERDQPDDDAVARPARGSGASRRPWPRRLRFHLRLRLRRPRGVALSLGLAARSLGGLAILDRRVALLAEPLDLVGERRRTCEHSIVVVAERHRSI